MKIPSNIESLIIDIADCIAAENAKAGLIALVEGSMLEGVKQTAVHLQVLGHLDAARDALLFGKAGF